MILIVLLLLLILISTLGGSITVGPIAPRSLEGFKQKKKKKAVAPKKKTRPSAKLPVLEDPIAFAPVQKPKTRLAAEPKLELMPEDGDARTMALDGGREIKLGGDREISFKPVKEDFAEEGDDAHDAAVYEEDGDSDDGTVAAESYANIPLSRKVSGPMAVDASTASSVSAIDVGDGFAAF